MSWLRHLEARIGYWHARGVFRRFERSARDVAQTQTRALQKVLRLVGASDYGRQLGLDRVRSPAEFVRAAPLCDYEALRPAIEKVMAGQIQALFAPGTRVHMFATTSGTTSKSKFIPVTDQFITEYRRGWNTFGLRMLMDHRGAFFRPILQVTGRHDESIAPGGLPCGAITGLLARLQKGIVRKFYVGSPDIVRITDSNARYYTLMRFGILNDLGFAITANPATLIRLARIADAESETLIRDVHDGTLAERMVPDIALRGLLERRLQPAPKRARQLEWIRSRRGRLVPANYWRTSFLACWTGGSMGHYLPIVADLWGELPVRDIGLLASEGRVTIPLQDGNPAGVLDSPGAFFEFIPAEQSESPTPDALRAEQLEIGHDYCVVVTNSAGLIRYRLDDVVRMHGRFGTAPVLEFLYRAGRVSSLAGEKLTENQVVMAVERARAALNLAPFDFALAPRWGDPPYYCLTTSCQIHNLSEIVDAELCALNEEYQSRRKSLRLNKIEIRVVPGEAFSKLDSLLAAKRGSAPEQYKRNYLFTQVDADSQTLGLKS